MTTYLRPTAGIAADALLPGDPKRAMDLAVLLMQKPLMSNLSRGLWGYHGCTSDGRELTVQSTGIGGPSAAAVVAELAGLGLRRAIRVGTCIALDSAVELGQAIVATEVVPADGVGSALAGDEVLHPDLALTQALLETTGADPARVVSADLHPAEVREGWRESWQRRGSVAVELSAASVLAVGAERGVKCACALVVAETLDGSTIPDEALDQAALALGERAAAALAAAPQASAPARPS